MRVITARNVNGAWVAALRLLLDGDGEAERETTRNGDAIVFPEPVTTEYLCPRERVLFCPERDANPFFHLFESMWMLAGSSDARWLDTYVHDFSERFAERGGHIHGAYGHRWRHNFYVRHLNGAETNDQMVATAGLLRSDPTTRQAVMAMWSPERDLNINVRDKPCNTHVYFRMRHGQLDMTVCCRSNDIVWGAYGANAVHMSMMHEYMAALVGCQLGVYHQVSNNWHGYCDVLDRLDRYKITWADIDRYSRSDGVSASELFTEEGAPYIHQESMLWMSNPTKFRSPNNQQLFDQLLVPMAIAHELYQRKDWSGAKSALAEVLPEDWRLACSQWLDRRSARWALKHQVITEPPTVQDQTADLTLALPAK